LETQIRLDGGRAAALGDAAIQLAVLDWASADTPQDRLRRASYTFEGVDIEVEIIPSIGLIDLNNTSESLLQALFVYAAGVEPAHATQLAQRIIDWRDADDAPLPQGAEADAYLAAGVNWRPRNAPFLVPEDLLQVLGVDFDLFARIEPLITVWGGGNGVNPMAAPVPVLAVLCQGDMGETMRIATARDAGETGVDTTALEQTLLMTGNMGNILHILASVPAEAGRWAVRGRWVVLRSDGDGTPWQTIRAEAVRFVAPAAETF
ncbi:MAG: general secretion pathway protein GspK, partial [Azoarcus sp.]|nr:general secretion pathway protein GspK [Azoarcus sp.]